MIYCSFKAKIQMHVKINLPNDRKHTKGQFLASGSGDKIDEAVKSLGGQEVGHGLKKGMETAD